METPLVHAYALPAGIGFLPTFSPLRMKLQKKPQNQALNKHVHTHQSKLHKQEKKKKGENQEWQTKDSSQFSLAQLRQDHRRLFNHQVQAAPPASEQAGAAS